MARPKTEERRQAILDAATRVIASQGLGAPTALIAKEAGVSNGSLFGYFETKVELLNQLYIELKTEMASDILNGLPGDADVRGQLEHMWSGWLRWAVAETDKRRALALLTACDDVTPASRDVGHRSMTDIVAILERSRDNGPMHAAPLGLVVGLMNAVAEATVDFIAHDPSHADAHSRMGFDAMWRMLG